MLEGNGGIKGGVGGDAEAGMISIDTSYLVCRAMFLIEIENNRLYVRINLRRRSESNRSLALLNCASTLSSRI